MDPNVNVSKGVIRKQRVRVFQNSWLDENIFKGWLAPHSEPNKAFCNICNKSIACCKTNLVAYSQSVKHITKINSLNKTGQLS